VSDTHLNHDSHDTRSNIKSAILIGAVLALVASNVYLYLRIDSLRTEMDQQRGPLLTEIAGLKELASVSGDAQRQHLSTLRNELDSARQQAVTAASQAKREALNRTELMARQLAEQQRQQQQQVASELSEVKQAATTAHTKLDSVSSEVSN
jgi:hypothetical protein